MSEQPLRIGVMSAERQLEDSEENLLLFGSITERGHIPVMINYPEMYVANAREGRLVLEPDEKGNYIPIEVDAVIPRIGEDVEAGLDVLEVFESNGIYSTASSLGIRVAKDKMKTQIALDKAGVPVAYSISPAGRLSPASKTIPNHPEGMVDFVQPDPAKRIVHKPNHGTRGEGIKPIEGSSARNHAATMVHHKADFMLQECVEPLDSEELAEGEKVYVSYRLVVIGGLYRAAMKLTSKKFGANKSGGAIAEKYDPTPRQQDLAIKATQALGLEAAGVDEIEAERDDLVVDVNDGFGFKIRIPSEVDVPGLLVDLAIKGAMKRLTPEPASQD